MNKTAEALRLIRKVIRLPLGKNCHFKQTEFFQLLTEMSCLNWFAEGISNAFRGLLPQADDLFYHIKKLSVEQTQTLFDALIKQNVKKARLLNLLRKRVWVAVDITTDPFYGKPNSFTRGGKEKAGTHWGYQYATASIVQDGRRLIIAALPFTPLDSLDDVLERLLAKCCGLVRIECLLLDRGFFGSPVLRVLEREKLDYVMPGVKNKAIKRLASGLTAFPATVERELNGFPIRLVFVKDEEDVLVFCTNRACWRSKLTEYYAKRWGIETSYRVCDGLQAKTCSRSVVVRMFLTYFAIALYNALQLAKAATFEERKPIALALRLFVLANAFAKTGADPP